MANTSCPIELEPKTLNEVQLTEARELAAEVVEMFEPSEASALFVEGIVHPIKEVTHIDENEKQVEKLIDFTKKAETIPYEEVCQCQCSCSCSAESQSYIVDVKEPFSAPF